MLVLKQLLPNQFAGYNQLYLEQTEHLSKEDISFAEDIAGPPASRFLSARYVLGHALNRRAYMNQAAFVLCTPKHRQAE